MIYCLIHCYSDNNKGDLGIILGTIEAIRENDKDAKIIAISTYNYDDPLFKTEHVLLRPYVDEMLPAFFGILNKKNKPGNSAGFVSKVLLNIRDGFRFLAFYKLNKYEIANKFINEIEKECINKMLNSDIVISKGGSFLCNENTLREKVSLYRILYPFLLCKLKNVDYYILGQSIGPVFGARCIDLMNNVIKDAKKVFIREKKCIEKYSYLNLNSENISLGRDFAFKLNCIEPIPIEINKNNMSIGVTVKFVEENKNYDSMIINSINYLINKYNADIYLITHVHIDKDGYKSWEILNGISESNRKKIKLVDDNYTVAQLRYIYSQMDFNICTRLHSAIFSLSTITPAICIAYHGTKAQGIYELFNLENYVVTGENYNSDYLIKIIDNLILNKKVVQQMIKKGVTETREIINNMIKIIVEENLYKKI